MSDTTRSDEHDVTPGQIADQARWERDEGRAGAFEELITHPDILGDSFGDLRSAFRAEAMHVINLASRYVAMAARLRQKEGE